MLNKLAAKQNAIYAKYKESNKSVYSDLEKVQSSDVSDKLVEYDFFISHASEDKDFFVSDLAKGLRASNAKVWYDEHTLKVGDSLRTSIDQGLQQSRFGVVVLSEHFFKKEWTNKELDGLFALEEKGVKRILPIWHKVSKDEVLRFSPILADKVALNTTIQSVDEIIKDLIDLLK